MELKLAKWVSIRGGDVESLLIFKLGWEEQEGEYSMYE